MFNSVHYYKVTLHFPNDKLGNNYYLTFG